VTADSKTVTLLNPLPPPPLMRPACQRRAAFRPSRSSSVDGRARDRRMDHLPVYKSQLLSCICSSPSTIEPRCPITCLRIARMRDRAVVRVVSARGARCDGSYETARARDRMHQSCSVAVSTAIAVPFRQRRLRRRGCGCMHPPAPHSEPGRAVDSRRRWAHRRHPRCTDFVVAVSGVSRYVTFRESRTSLPRCIHSRHSTSTDVRT